MGVKIGYARVSTEDQNTDLQLAALTAAGCDLHHEKASREIERELGLEYTRGALFDREGPRPERRPDESQMEQGKRTKHDPHEVKAEVSALYAAAEDGRAFVEGLEAAGYTLAQGDKRGYVVLDEVGGVHSLSRAAGAKAGALREVLQDYPPENLPSVAQARELIQDRTQEREAKAPMPEIERERTPEPEAPAIEPERHSSTAPEIDTRGERSLEKAEAVAGRAVDALDRGITDAVLAVGEAFDRAMTDLFCPDTPEERRQKQAEQRREAAHVRERAEERQQQRAKEEQQDIDLKRYFEDAEYRRQLWREEIAKQEARRKDREREQEDGGRERDR